MPFKHSAKRFRNVNTFRDKFIQIPKERTYAYDTDTIDLFVINK